MSEMPTLIILAESESRHMTDGPHLANATTAPAALAVPDTVQHTIRKGLASGLQVALALHLFVIACAVSSGAIAWLFPAGEAPKPTAAPQSGLQSAPSAAPEARAHSSAE